jgi:hypothetical protein
VEIRIPIFRTSLEAMNYGQVFSENKDIVRALKAARKQTLAETREIAKKLESATLTGDTQKADQYFNQAIKKATLAQFYREAIDVAEGKL